VGQFRPAMDPSLAEWWQRLVARLLDGLILALITSPLWIWYFAWYFQNLPADLFATDTTTAPNMSEIMRLELRLMGMSLLFGLVQAIVYFAYDWFQHAKWGQTIGKRIMKIKVVTVDDRELMTGGAAAKRAAAFTLAPQVPLVGGPFALMDVLWPLWDKPHRQALHDKFAHTIVIKTNQ
jgi:uncharacterized RDD family membrane protein YckC